MTPLDGVGSRYHRVVAEDAGQVAKRLAERMPFVHSPGDAAFDEVARWRTLRSKRARGLPPSRPDSAATFRDRHVFAYAGPACFVGERGTVVLFFDPSIDHSSGPGAVCRFDTGALLEPQPMCLQPWAGARIKGTPGRKLDFARVDACSAPLATWRSRFETWLSYSYDSPARCLEHGSGRYRDARPDRLVPPELLAHNGVRPAADRRAWTWEARFEGEIAIDQIAAVMVPYEQANQAAATLGSWRLVRAIGQGNEPVTPDLVYRRSIEVLKELTR